MATQPSDNTEFPQELILKPLALIGLSGLDTVNNAVHKTIWDAFSNNRRADRAAVRFKLLNNTLEFPVVKPKRNSYEWYIPKGILKKNWINKRLALIPALVVIFYDMEWEDPQWNEKIIECASRVQSVRAAVEGHACRVAVVVLQSGGASPSDGPLGAERAHALYTACEITSKALFVLPHNDHLMGYIVCLENAFHDMAQSYYHYEGKSVKQHKEHLNKTTHQYLFVRHQFKLAYLHEMKQDPSAAHKHYLHAYNNLLETRMVDTNVHEVRTVAGYINYKLCKLLFALNLPRDAIAQLKAHIDRYKSKVGPTQLLFEHYAWIARQYSAFGELFDEAIAAGLPAVQAQHPGFYYQQAAQYTTKRRHAMRSLCLEVTQYPTPDPLDGCVDYYGQRPWRPGRLSADPHDPQKEEAAIQALQYNERNFNHSNSIINYLGSAISQFKTFHSPRMRNQLVVEMANEYYLCADYGKALTLLTHMLWDYRKEKWWHLASHVLNKALQCAYLAAKVHDYLQLAVEALSKHICIPNNDKNRIYQNIMSVLNVTIPGAEPELPPACLPKAMEAWRLAIDRDPFNVSIDMANISSFIQVKPTFRQHKYRVDENIEIDLFITLSYLSSLCVKRVYMSISNGAESMELPVLHDNTLLAGGQVNKLTAHLDVSPGDSGKQVHIKCVTLVLDNDRKRKLLMNFKIEESQKHGERHHELLHLLLSPKAEFDSMVAITSVQLVARECCLRLHVHNDGPALQGEWFPSVLTLTNEEHDHIRDITIALVLLTTPDNPNPDAVTELTLAEAEQPHARGWTHKSVRQGEAITNTFYIKSNRTATTTIQIRVSYNLNLPHHAPIQCVKDFTTKITVVKPFDVSVQFVSLNFKSITKCYVDEPFIVMPQIKILSPWPLLIEDTDLDVNDCFRCNDEEKSPSSVCGVHANEGGLVSDALCITTKYKPKDNPTHVGLYNITWRRRGDNLKSVMSSTVLSGLPIEECPISLRVSYPEVVELQTCVPLRCTITGKATTPTRLCVSVEGTDGYMFSGYQNMCVIVPPQGTIQFLYNLHPLTTGLTTPPRVTATVLNEDGTRDSVKDMLHKTLPHHIYVMPKYH